MINLQLGDVGHTIQLAIAPVFLLTGVGTKLSVLTSRLARIIDRARVVEQLLRTEEGKRIEMEAELEEELDELYRRSHLINRAITLSTTTGLLICLVIAALFVGGILSLIGSFIFFMREIFVATLTLSRQHQRDKIRRLPR